MFDVSGTWVTDPDPAMFSLLSAPVPPERGAVLASFAVEEEETDQAANAGAEPKIQPQGHQETVNGVGKRTTDLDLPDVAQVLHDHLWLPGLSLTTAVKRLCHRRNIPKKSPETPTKRSGLRGKRLRERVVDRAAESARMWTFCARQTFSAMYSAFSFSRSLSRSTVRSGKL